jgi:hypothetical protein
MLSMTLAGLSPDGFVRDDALGQTGIVYDFDFVYPFLLEGELIV